MAGPNGSGKTTFARIALAKSKTSTTFLNPYLIASGLSTLQSNQASFQAGRVLLLEMKERMAKGDSFGFESTLSGKIYLSLISRAKRLGYSITIYFIHLNSVTQSLKRIQKRVKEGGHDIPKNAVKRRNSRCFFNFWNLYRPLADDWFVFNNSKKKPILSLSKEEFETSSRQKEIQATFLKGIKNGK